MLLEKIKEAGIVGCGGAGFPTATKLATQAEYFIINAAECEPLLKTDHYVMDHFASECIKAIAAVGKILDAKKIVIATKKYYTHQIQQLQTAIEEQNAPIEIFKMDNFYPAGDEQIMVYEITGRTVPPGGIPISVGCVVSNIATMLNVYESMADIVVTHKYLTITGAVANPCILYVPIGTSFKECLEQAGGTSLTEFLFLNGGPMMGAVGDESTFDQQVVTKTTSGIIIFEKSGFILDIFSQTDQTITNTARSSCIQCTLCTDLCPRYLIGHPLHPHRIMRHLAISNVPDSIDDDPIWQEALLCCECGICEVIACPMELMPRQVNIYVKKILAEKGIRYQAKDQELVAHEMRDLRKVPPKNILLKDELQRYADLSIEERRDYEPTKVRIPLQMHIGAPSTAIVAINQEVTRGELIAEIPEKSLGAKIHASIDGKITAITSHEIEIERMNVR